MPAFSYNRVCDIERIFKRLSSRLTNSIKSDLTTAEIFDAYVKPEDRETLTRIFSLISIGSAASTMISHNHNHTAEQGNYVLTISLNFGKDDVRWVVPNYTNKGMRKDAPLEVKAKIDRWITKRVKAGREFGMAYSVFDHLNNLCNSPTALAYMMPAMTGIVGLIEEDDPKKRATLTKLHDKMNKPGLPTTPFVTEEVREVSRAAGPLIAKAMLLDKTLEAAPTGIVTLSLNHQGGARTPWGTVAYFM